MSISPRAFFADIVRDGLRLRIPGDVDGSGDDEQILRSEGHCCVDHLDGKLAAFGSPLDIVTCQRVRPEEE